EQFPAVIVFPQVESFDERILSAWSPESPDGRRALAILSEVEKQESIDPARRSLVGWSMGGFGVWQIATNSPQGFWKSALSISGGAVETDPTRLPEGLAFWAIHGSSDRI